MGLVQALLPLLLWDLLPAPWDTVTTAELLLLLVQLEFSQAFMLPTCPLFVTKKQLVGRGG